MRSQEYINVMNRVKVNDELEEKILDAYQTSTSDSLPADNENFSGSAENIRHINKILPIAASLILVIGMAAGGVFFLERNIKTDNRTPAVNFSETAYTTEPSELISDEQKVIPLAEVTDQWKNNVYFGSQFPLLIYADEKICVFSEGYPESVFIYDFEKRDITFSANIKQTFDNAGLDDMGAESWNGISFDAYHQNDGIGILCSANWPEKDKTLNYYIDMENRTLVYIENFDMKDFSVIQRPGLSSVIPEGVTDNFSDFVCKSKDDYIYIANSNVGHGGFPDNGSHLPLIEIVKCTNGVIERFRPFADMEYQLKTADTPYDYREEIDISTEINTFSIKIPAEFNKRLNSYDVTLENGDTVYLEWIADIEFPETEKKDDEVHRLFVQPEFEGIKKTDEQKVEYTVETEEDRSAAGLIFSYKTGNLKIRHAGETSASGSLFPYAAYYGFGPYDPDYDGTAYEPIMWIAYSDSDDPETIEYIQNTVKNIGLSAEIQTNQ